MILVADSGSTNTDWAVIEKDKITSSFKTKGFSPFFTTSDEIHAELLLKTPKEIKADQISHIYFYGSGCSSTQLNGIVNEGLKQSFPFSAIEINHDLLAAARALFMSESGIAVILGTGANTCFYNGSMIVKNIPSLGYILGDEGGGDYLGKLFLTELLYGNISDDIQTEFQKKYGLSNSDLLYKIYKEPNPNRFLASFCDFILQHSKNPEMDKIIKKSFTDLFLNHITKYENYRSHKIRVTGSVGFHFQEHLKELANKYETSIDFIEQHPIMRLAQYHITKKD